MISAAVVIAIWAALLAGFTLGVFWAGRKVLDLETDLARLKEQNRGLRAAQDHRGCQLVNDRLAQTVVAQQHHIDHLEARLDRPDLDTELRQLLDGGTA